MLADHQSTLDLTSVGDDGGVTRVQLAPAPAAKTQLYLHLRPASLDRGDLDLGDLDLAGALGSAERLGPITATTIREWVGHSRVTVTPVLDLARVDAVDQHDPPPWMRELVILRDTTCVFPRCARPARRCDLDHIKAYDTGPPQTGPPQTGPPLGQTHPRGLAPLCRRHHRAKTLGRWSYTRDADGTYTWTGPQGQLSTVRPDDHR